MQFLEAVQMVIPSSTISASIGCIRDKEIDWSSSVRV